LLNVSCKRLLSNFIADVVDVIPGAKIACELSPEITFEPASESGGMARKKLNRPNDHSEKIPPD
jgi:hypothetical protein